MNRSAADAEQILQSRARALARRPAGASSGLALIELLEFRLASERYAVESRYVQEVHPLRELTPLPGVPAFVLGIVNLRGRVLPVFDLKKFFELPDKGLTDLHRIVLVRRNDIELGILADVMVGVRTVMADHLQPTLPTLTGIRADYLKGIGDEGLVVLDLECILSDPRIIVHQEMET